MKNNTSAVVLKSKKPPDENIIYYITGAITRHYATSPRFHPILPHIRLIEDICRATLPYRHWLMEQTPDCG
ncbi:TPA: hypothetical protein I8Y12_002857 [Raoultella planticola]|nr:hypothetical protein [Raoultella planticola]